MLVNFEDGTTVRVHSDFPTFDSMKAKPGQGVLPPAEKFPGLAGRLDDIFKKTTIVHPIFRRMAYKRHSLLHFLGNHAPDTNNTWAGGIVQAPLGDSICWIEGLWTMPNADPPPGGQDGIWYSASTWIGIDGQLGSGDILQAGCDVEIKTWPGLNPQRAILPWFQWYPGGPISINNLPVAPGDVLSCVVAVQTFSPLTATIYMYNKTQNVSPLPYSVSPPIGTGFLGNCAEWIVEAVQLDGNYSIIPKFQPVEFSSCTAGTVKNVGVTTNNATTIDMTDASGNVIARGEIAGPDVRVTHL